MMKLPSRLMVWGLILGAMVFIISTKNSLAQEVQRVEKLYVALRAEAVQAARGIQRRRDKIAADVFAPDFLARRAVQAGHRAPVAAEIEQAIHQ